MQKDEIKRILENAYGPMEKQCLKLDTGEVVSIKFTSLSLNNGKTPFTQAYFDSIAPKNRHFILAGDGKYTLKEDLSKHKISDDYIVAIEPKLVPTGTPVYGLPNISDVFAQIAKDPSIGLYRHEVDAPSQPFNSLCAVFIKVSENGQTTDLYLKRYFAASDHRTYQNVTYTIGAVTGVDSVNLPDNDQATWPKNLLIFGAPGTGKSFAISQKLKELGWQDCMQRVTFYEDYSYEKFVGSYVPQKGQKETKMEGALANQNISLKTSGDGITYEFTPGPFLQMIADAWLDQTLNLHTPHVLVIEEINRANAASVFGDMFQLLDRTSTGESEYVITLPAEMKAWLVQYLKKKLRSLDFEGDRESQVEAGLQRITDFADHFKLPPNLYLWATMNSADQGVFPLDSAFKRRWSFLYKSISSPRTDNNQYLAFPVKSPGQPIFIHWDTFRSAINRAMASDENNIEEDRLLGAWYFKPAEMQQIYTYAVADPLTRLNLPNPICDKLLHYLRQDVFRNNPGALFRDGYHSMYQLRQALANGTPIQNLLKIELKNADILSADAIPFTVKDGKRTVTLGELKKAGLLQDDFLLDFNSVCHDKAASLDSDTKKGLIDAAMEQLKAGCTEAEKMNQFLAQLEKISVEEPAENTANSVQGNEQ